MIERRALARRRTLVSIALVVLIVAVPALVFVWGRRSNTFAVKHITVAGADQVDADEAARVLRAAFLGDNLFSIDEDDVTKALSSFPYVAGVEIDRDFPSTLRVTIVEYRPAALLEAAGRWYLVSGEGHVLATVRVRSPGATASPSPGASVTALPSAAATASPGSFASPSPSATASPGAAAATGLAAGFPPPATAFPSGLRRLPAIRSDERVAIDEDVADDRVRDALALIEALPPAVRLQVRSAVAGGGSARIGFRDGLLVEFGDAADLAFKVAALEAVLRRYRAKGVEPTLIDVSVPHRPFGSPQLTTPSPPPSPSTAAPPAPTPSPAPP